MNNYRKIIKGFVDLTMGLYLAQAVNKAVPINDIVTDSFMKVFRIAAEENAMQNFSIMMENLT